jgi:thioredoxin 1
MRKALILVCILSLAVSLVFAVATEEKKTQDSAKADTVQKDGDTGIKVTFVELGSVRCIPCKKMMPIMEEIKKKYKGQVKVVFHDVWTDEGKPFIKKYKVRLIPTQIFYDRDGKEYFRHEGFFPKDELVKVLQKQGVK